MSVGEVVQVFFVVDGMLTEMITVKQAAYRLKYHERTIQRWADEGKLIAINVEGRVWVDAAQINSVAAALDLNGETVAS